MLHYNDGACGINAVLSYFSICSGIFMESGTFKKNMISMKKMNIKSTVSGKKRGNIKEL